MFIGVTNSPACFSFSRVRGEGFIKMAVCHSSFFSLRLTPFCLVDAAADVLVVLSDSVAAMRVMRIMMIVMLMCVCDDPVEEWSR